MPKCNFNKVAVNLLHTFRTTFLKNTSGWLLLVFIIPCSDLGNLINRLEHGSMLTIESF